MVTTCTIFLARLRYTCPGNWLVKNVNTKRNS
jgi:hypothetical protein